MSRKIQSMSNKSAQIPSKLLPRFPSKNSEQTAKIEVGAIFAFTKEGFHDSQNIKLREKKLNGFSASKKKFLLEFKGKMKRFFSSKRFPLVQDWGKSD